MSEHFDELALAFAKAAPFVKEGRGRLKDGLEQAFRNQAATVLEGREDWALVSGSDEASELAWSPKGLGCILYRIAWSWDDDAGATVRVSIDSRGRDWVGKDT